MKVYPEDDYGEKAEDKTVKNTLTNFTINTNIEGINNAGRSREKIRIFAWAVIFLVLVCLTCNDIRQLVGEYYEYPVDVSTTLEHKNAIDFPSVTICNKNRVSCKQLKNFRETECKAKSEFCEHPKELNLLWQLGKCDAKEPEDLPKPSGRTSSTTKVKSIRKKKGKKKDKQSKDTLGKTLNVNLQQSKNFAIEQKFLMTYLELSEMERFSIGHQLRDLIKSCSFRGVDCLETIDTDDEESLFMDYDVIISPNFGNCYNIYMIDDSMGKSSLTGASYGLSLVLNIEQEDYLKGGQTLAAGARMSIQDKKNLPLMDEYGIDIAPHALTSISLQVVNITRHAYSGCTGSSWESSLSEQYKEQLEEHYDDMYSYSMTVCQKLCIQQSIQDLCECSHPLFASAKDFRSCDLAKGTEDAECVTDVIIDYDTGERECECGPPCREMDFEKLISSTVWPGKSATIGFSELYKVNPEDVENDYLKIDIYFMSLNVKSITESARYNLVTFISTIGGSLGVWIGFSVCMVFEILELGIDLCLACILSKNKVEIK